MPSKVQIYAYDLTHGMAAALSPVLLGQRIEGVWHTAVVIDGKEEIFFGYGINRARAGTTMFGKPHHVIDLGTTEVDKEMRDELLSDIAPRYRPQDYSLLWHNCNHFSHEYGQLLTGEGLPDYIMNQAQVVFNTPWGESLMPMIMQMEGFTGRATVHGLAQEAMASAQAAAATAAAQPSSSAAAAARQPPNTVPVAPAPPPVAETSAAAAAASPGSREAANAASAAANAAMEREARFAEAAAAEVSASAAGGSETAAAGGSGAARSSSVDVAAAASAHAVDEVSHAAEAAAQKVTSGVAGLNLTADSRVHADQSAVV